MLPVKLLFSSHDPKCSLLQLVKMYQVSMPTRLLTQADPKNIMKAEGFEATAFDELRMWYTIINAEL